MNNLKILIFGFIICIFNAFSIPLEIDKIAIIINDDIVLESDIKNLFKFIKFNSEQDNILLINNNSLRYQLIENLINDSIQLQLAKKININISNIELDNIINNIALKNKITVNQLRNYLFSYNINYDIYRSQIYKEIVINEIRNNMIRHKIIISSQEINELIKLLNTQNFINPEINISYILFTFPSKNTPYQVQKLEIQVKKIIDKLKNSSDFQKIAKLHSIHSSILKYENMGWNKLENILPIFAKYLINSKKDMIFGPIHSFVGFYILKVNDIRHINNIKFVTEYHVRHIFLKVTKFMNDKKIQSKLENILKYIQKGYINFYDAAKQISQDLNSSIYGGDLGWISLEKKKYDSIFYNVLLKLKKGEISLPIKSSFGWHLIQLLDTKNINQINFIKKNYAYQILLNRKFFIETQHWIQKLRSQTYVKIINNNIKE
ncbi:Chaperone SurA [Serratia symbiotica]|nr:Chaperone SurA [Serratia symbiotica]